MSGVPMTTNVACPRGRGSSTWVVAIALPRIETDLELSRAVMTWTMSAYTLTFGGLLLPGGRIADLAGARRVVLAGLSRDRIRVAGPPTSEGDESRRGVPPGKPKSNAVSSPVIAKT